MGVNREKVSVEMVEVDLSDSRNYRGVSKELHPVIQAAHALTWTAKKQGGGLVLRNPDGTHGIHIPAGKTDSTLRTTLMRRVLRNSPPDLVVEMEKAHTGAGLGAVRAHRDGYLTQDAVDEAVEVMDRTAPVFNAVREAGGAFGVTPEMLTPEPAVFITDVHPWMARVGSNGKTSDFYPSNSVNERVWSDGSKDYVCPVCETFTSDNPRSVGSHAGQAHTKKGQKAPSDTAPTVFNASVDGYNNKRYARLAREIEAALADTPWDGKGDRAMFARALAEHIVEDRHRRGLDKIEEEAEPSTPEDILARIKRLVMRDEADHIKAAQDRAAQLAAQLAVAEEERDKAVRKAERYRETLDTLSSLAKEETG